MGENRGILDGKIALISGAASGIGQVTAELFAAEGASVTIFDRDERGRHVAETIADGGGRAIFVGGDVTDAEACRHAVEATRESLGGLDILFNNAGVVHRGSVLATNEDEWDRVMAINVKGLFLLSRAALPVMIRQGQGVIINMGSGWGLVGGKDAAVYCASKGAVVQLTRAMAIDHGPSGIRVNCLCPGDTATPMLEREAAQLGEPVERFLTNAAARPLGRIGDPEDIAQAALFLASDASRFITGTTLVVDGGGLAG